MARLGCHPVGDDGLSVASQGWLPDRPSVKWHSPLVQRKMKNKGYSNLWNPLAYFQPKQPRTICPLRTLGLKKIRLYVILMISMYLKLLQVSLLGWKPTQWCCSPRGLGFVLSTGLVSLQLSPLPGHWHLLVLWVPHARGCGQTDNHNTSLESAYELKYKDWWL